MAARGNMVLKDRTSPTPVDHTFSPDGDDANGVHVYSEKTGVPAGNSRITTSLKQSGDKYRSVVKTSIPVVATQTINGVSSPVVVRTIHLETTMRVENTSTTQERADAVGIHSNALATANTQVNDLLVNLVDTW